MVISTFESCGGLGSRCSCGVLSGVFPTVIVLCLNYLPSEPISLTSSICLLLFFIYFFFLQPNNFIVSGVCNSSLCLSFIFSTNLVLILFI